MTPKIVLILILFLLFMAISLLGSRARLQRRRGAPTGSASWRRQTPPRWISAMYVLAIALGAGALFLVLWMKPAPPESGAESPAQPVEKGMRIKVIRSASPTGRHAP